MLLVKKIKLSNTHGMGLFADQDIKKGDEILQNYWEFEALRPDLV